MFENMIKLPIHEMSLLYWYIFFVPCCVVKTFSKYCCHPALCNNQGGISADDPTWLLQRAGWQHLPASCPPPAPAAAAALGAAADEPDLCLILTDKDTYIPLV